MAPRRQGNAVSYDGTRIAFRVYGPERERAVRTLVLTNGLSCCEIYWEELVPVLADDYRIVTWDFRGHGGSEEAADGNHSIESASRDLDAVLAATETSSAVHGGFSMGVPVILERLRRSDDGFDGFVAIQGPHENPVCSLPGFASRSGGRRLASLLSLLHPVAPLLALFVAPFVRSDTAYRLAIALRIISDRCPRATLAHAMDHATAMRPRTFLSTAVELCRYSARDVLPRVRVPTLILAGAHDVLCPLPVAREMAREIPDATLEVLSDASHAGPLEMGAEIGAAIRRFLRDLGPAERPPPSPSRPRP